MIITNQMLITF